MFLVVVTVDGSDRIVGDGRHVMVRRCRLVHDRIKAVVIVGGVVNGAHRAIGLDQRVLSLHDVAIALLGLGFDVAGVRILDAVVERVLGIGL